MSPGYPPWEFRGRVSEATAAVSVDFTPSFVDGIGGPRLEPEMWELSSELLQGSLLVDLDQVAAAVKLLAERSRIVAEGAGASSVAAALTGAPEARKVVCVVSGGNLDISRLLTILDGGVP